MSELAPVACLLRSLPLLCRTAPKTSLRVLAIMAIDTLHVLRHSRALPRKRMTELALLLDFQACANAACDNKHLCNAEYQGLRQQLEQAGHGPVIAEHLRRLCDLESRRPLVGGDHRRFEEVRLYREEVARLSLATAIAMDADRLDEEIQATQSDQDANALFRMVMQCQIIDDVLDYRDDRSAGLPSFMTACASLAQSIESTSGASRHYAASQSRGSVFPLRMALCACTAAAKLALRIADRRHRGVDDSPPLVTREADALDPLSEARIGAPRVE